MTTAKDASETLCISMHFMSSFIRALPRYLLVSLMAESCVAVWRWKKREACQQKYSISPPVKHGRSKDVIVFISALLAIGNMHYFWTYSKQKVVTGGVQLFRTDTCQLNMRFTLDSGVQSIFGFVMRGYVWTLEELLPFTAIFLLTALTIIARLCRCCERQANCCRCLRRKCAVSANEDVVAAGQQSKEQSKQQTKTQHVNDLSALLCYTSPILGTAYVLCVAPKLLYDSVMLVQTRRDQNRIGPAWEQITAICCDLLELAYMSVYLIVFMVHYADFKQQLFELIPSCLLLRRCKV